MPSDQLSYSSEDLRRAVAIGRTSLSVPMPTTPLSPGGGRSGSSGLASSSSNQQDPSSFLLAFVQQREAAKQLYTDRMPMVAVDVLCQASASVYNTLRSVQGR